METTGEQARSADGASGMRRDHHDDEAVRRRAYELYQARGGHGGSDVDDWYAAERELRGQRGQPDDVRPARDRGAMDDREAGAADGTREARDDGASASAPEPRQAAAPLADGPTGSLAASRPAAPRTTRSRRKGG